MKKFAAGVTVALASGALFIPATAAQAVCANQAIWTQDGDAGVVKKWSTDGDLLATIDANIQASDMAISSDLEHFLAPSDGGIDSWNSSTGADETTIDVDWSTSSYQGGAGAGVIAGNKLLVDSDNVIVAVDLDTNVAADWADLADGDASVDVGLRGGSWTVAGDLLQLPDGDVLAVANNSSVSENVILVRIDKTTTSDVTVVGTVSAGDEVWGAARAGDDIFLATAGGALLKVASIPTAASLDEVTTTEIVSGGGSFWGAAGSNDSTDGNATCEIAETGLDAAPMGLGAAALIAAGGIALAVRRRKA
ncbi:MAG: hypothetical protein ACKOWN_02980 [Microbacteriaceae bacterium]